MKILAVASQFDRSEARLLALLSEEADVELSVVTEGSGRFDFELPDTIHQRFTAAFRSRLDIGAIRKLRRIITSVKPDVIHLFSARAVSNVLVASMFLSPKLVAYRGTMGHLGRLDPSSYLSFLNPKLSKIICVSRAVEEYLWTVGVPPSKTVTIHKGHDFSWYCPAPRQGAQPSPKPTRQDLQIPGSATVVGCVANIRPVKGVDILLNAFAMLAKQTNLYLLLIGDIRDKKVSELIDRAANRERIITTGFRTDAPDVVALCDIFTMPSIAREGLPKALIEAMAKGVAPIVTRVGGMPEVVTHNQHGLVVPPSDPASLAGAISLLANDEALRVRLAAAATERIKSSFNIKDTARKTLSVYGEITQNKP